MMGLQPRGLNRRRVEQLLFEARSTRSIENRIDIISRRLVGSPYKSNPLVGSADTDEVFSASFGGFDCVTYIETIIALARASTLDHFVRLLRNIRYEQGLIRWDKRNHYMTGWIRNNTREGILGPISTRGIPTRTIERTLDVVPGIEATQLRMKCVPKAEAPQLVLRLRTGDLMFFVSTRKHLDVFHAGILIDGREAIHLRHASRSQGAV